MKRASLTSLAVILLLGFFAGVFAATLVGTIQLQPAPITRLPAHEINSSSIESVFSPGASIQIIREINSANSSLDIMLYQFSLDDYETALAKAVSRGIAVRIIFEPRVDSNYKTAEYLTANGIEVRWATREYTNTHSKTMVVDNRRVLVGSINWSRNAAKTNRESGAIIDDARVAAEFLEVFESDWAKAAPSNSTSASAVATPN